VLECVAHKHGCHGEEAEGRKGRHDGSIIAPRNSWEPGGPVTSSTADPPPASKLKPKELKALPLCVDHSNDRCEQFAV
jgi:hypothetical protein